MIKNCTKFSDGLLYRVCNQEKILIKDYNRKNCYYQKRSRILIEGTGVDTKKTKQPSHNFNKTKPLTLLLIPLIAIIIIDSKRFVFLLSQKKYEFIKKS